ncbi:MAG: hypothetical protein ABW185_21340 [Sedimenticola sp.]
MGRSKKRHSNTKSPFPIYLQCDDSGNSKTKSKQQKRKKSSPAPAPDKSEKKPKHSETESVSGSEIWADAEDFQLSDSEDLSCIASPNKTPNKTTALNYTADSMADVSVLSDMSDDTLSQSLLQTASGSKTTPGPGTCNGHEPSLGSSYGSLTEIDVDRIATRLRSVMLKDINDIVQAAVDGKTVELTSRISKLEAENQELLKTIGNVQNSQDELEQYSRRTCVLISNVKESEGEDIDDIIMDVAKKADVNNISPADIDHAHRNGRRKDGDSKPVDIIVKFKTYRARTTFLKGRKYLREHKISVYLNESLTRRRSELLYHCRLLKKDKDSPVTSAYSHDGKLFVKDKHDERLQIRSISDLEPLKPQATP